MVYILSTLIRSSKFILVFTILRDRKWVWSGQRSLQDLWKISGVDCGVSACFTRKITNIMIPVVSFDQYIAIKDKFGPRSKECWVRSGRYKNSKESKTLVQEDE